MPSRDEDLMLYVDGELPAREAHELEKRFASGKDGDDKAKLEGLRQVGDVVRARYEAAVEEAEPRFADMWARLDAALTPAPAPVASLGARLSAWWHNFRSHVLVGATCAAAGAVLVFVVMHQAHTRELVVLPAPAPDQTGTSAQATATEDEESLDVEDGSATVFRIPSEDTDEADTTVIWITRDDADSDTSSESPI